MHDDLFPPDFFRALASLSRRAAAAGIGRRSAPRAGSGFLGFEHRAARPGDSPRAVDWRATARIGRVQVRRRELERGGELLLVLDRSASLAPQHARRDLDQRRLALALGWLHLESGGRLLLATGSDGASDRGSRAALQTFAGWERRAALQAALAALPSPSGAAPPRVPRAARRAVVLDDPWSPSPEGLRSGCELVTLVLPEEDRLPSGGLALHGVEDGAVREVEIDPARWEARWSAWLDARRERARRAGARAHELRCGGPSAPASAILRSAEEAGLV